MGFTSVLIPAASVGSCGCTAVPSVVNPDNGHSILCPNVRHVWTSAEGIEVEWIPCIGWRVADKHYELWPGHSTRRVPALRAIPPGLLKPMFAAKYRQTEALPSLRDLLPDLRAPVPGVHGGARPAVSCPWEMGVAGRWTLPGLSGVRPDLVVVVNSVGRLSYTTGAGWKLFSFDYPSPQAERILMDFFLPPESSPDAGTDERVSIHHPDLADDIASDVRFVDLPRPRL